MPSRPVDRPEKTLVTMANALHRADQAIGLVALILGAGRVTVVDRAMLRRLSTTAPVR